MARKLIDHFLPLPERRSSDPPGNHPTIQYIDHQQGLPRMLRSSRAEGGGWRRSGLGGGSSVHLLHPQRHASRRRHGISIRPMNRGERSWTIDEVPLEWWSFSRA